MCMCVCLYVCVCFVCVPVCVRERQRDEMPYLISAYAVLRKPRKEDNVKQPSPPTSTAATDIDTGLLPPPTAPVLQVIPPSTHTLTCHLIADPATCNCQALATQT